MNDETTENDLQQNPANDPATDDAAGGAAVAPAAEETPPAAAPSTGDPFAAIGDAFVRDWPEAQPHFVQQVKAEGEAEMSEAEAEETARGGGVDFRFLRDKNRHFYNPDICSEKIDPATGLPEKTVRGWWVLKRGHSRDELKKTPPKTDAAGKIEPTGAQALEAERAALEEARRIAEANATATAQTLDLVAWMGIQAFTGQGADTATQQQGIAALKGWLLTMERPLSVPAWAVPLMIYGNAFATRFRSEAAAPKRKALREKVAGFFGYLKGRRAARMAQQQARGAA